MGISKTTWVMFPLLKTSTNCRLRSSKTTSKISDLHPFLSRERNFTAKEGTSKAETDHAPKKDTEETLDGKDDSKNLVKESRRNARTERLTPITSKRSDTLEENSPVKWNHTRNLHLMVAYGAVVYSITVSADEEITTRLVISKCRVILIKRVTIPRLELIAALVAARLVTYMAGQLSLMIDQITCWSDEKVTTLWIKSPRNGCIVMGKISLNPSNKWPAPVPAAIS
ncbi:DNA topoisomerase 2-alpha [Trichinella spiralis]|uniref:DNA topoisomerase 2-alpha n=1 Tax=Trichinella spiralis TaxID=6334 RepID=UPI0001EFB4BD|nr:DNA topoisomerase 2-alpha [Trichinella spiralis]